MRRSFELYFLANFIADFGLFTVVARANDCFRFRRILAAGIFAALYALLTEAFFLRLAHPAVRLALIVPFSVIICGDTGRSRWCCVALQLFCGAAILGGLGAMFSPSGVYAVTAIFIAGLSLVAALLSLRRRQLLTWEVALSLSFRGKTVAFRALIDTGNRLREPLSGLPVLIAESSLLQSVLPADTSSLPCRRVAFGGLGGAGTLLCFRPDRLLIRHGSRLIAAPEAWIAVYPGKIPGSARALAPPSFAVIPGGARQQFFCKGVRL